MTNIEILQMLFAFIAGAAITFGGIFAWALGQDSDAQAEHREMQRALKRASNDN